MTYPPESASVQSSQQASGPERKWSATIVCNDAGYFNRHRRSIADGLTERGARVEVLTGGDISAVATPHDWALRAVEVHRFGLNPVADFRFFRAVLKQMSQRRPQALLLITLKPAIVGGIAGVVSRALYGCPGRIQILIAGLGRLMSPASELSGRHAVSRRIVRTVIKFLSGRRNVGFIFETESDRKHWVDQGLVRGNNSTVVPGAGVDAGVFYPGTRGRAHGPLRVLFAARLLPAKGLDVFLEAARAFAGDGQIEFLVAGLKEPPGSGAISAEHLAAERAISFLGEVTDMAALLRSVDLVCLPSRYGEGIPRILIEAAACGLPAIASDLPGCLEIVEDGVTGTIVPAGLAGEPAKHVIRALQDYLGDRERLRHQGAAALKKFAGGGFESRQVVAEIAALLDPAAKA
jgi:glycosyltransferase involved in cell wall biosynthesis